MRSTASKPRTDEELDYTHQRIATLVKSVKNGDESDYAELLALAAPRAFRAAVAILRDQQEAEDAVQEGAIVAYKSMAQLREGEAFATWFLHIVVNKAIDLLRKRRREQERFDALTKTAKYRGGRERLDKETVMDIVQAVDQLPVNQKTVINLYYAGGYTTPEISKLIDRPEGTVRRFLSEAYKMLREALGPSLSKDSLGD